MKAFLKYSLASVLVGLCFSVMATPKGQTKNFVIRGHVEGVITEVASDYSWIKTVEVDIGESAFFGRHVNTLEAKYLLDAKGNTVGGTMKGESVSANRKGTIKWEAVPGATPTVTFTGGTGIYEGIQGSFVSTLSNVVVDLQSGVVSYDYVGIGEVTFP